MNNNNSNPLYNPEIYGSSSAEGTLTVSGAGPGTPGGNVLINPKGGNTGIGTNNPANTLSVNGNTDISGRVGIGTTSPSNSLSVNGNADFSGQVAVTGSVGIGSSSAPTNALAVTGNASIGINATSPVSLLTSTNPTGAAGFHWNLTNGGGETDFVNFTPKGTSSAFSFYNVTSSPSTSYTLPQTMPAPLFSISASGATSVPTNIINSSTGVNVANWNGSTASFNNNSGSLSSSGGDTINNQDGFSVTAGGGNYGYYGVDLNGTYSGYLRINMVLSKGGAGDGFWSIISSQNALTNNQNFQADSTAMQIWYSRQDISNGLLFTASSTYTMPVQVTVYFDHARSFYIGAVDLGNGQAGIQINNITVTPIVLGTNYF